MKNLFFIAFILIAVNCASQSNSCAGATTLTIDAALTCGQTTLGSTLEGGECITNYAGSSEVSVWYRIDATNDSLVLNFVQTNFSDCAPTISVYGPFANGAGCVPGCGSTIYTALLNGDPGSHILLTGLATSGNNDYLVQIQGNECGGPNDTETDFCIDAVNPDVNNNASSASLIDACGTAFTETTNGGYWQNGTSVGFNNLDGNAGTTCGGCPAGDDTPFIINNVSWTTFCSLTAGTWQLTVNGIGGCTLSAPNQGVQASVFTGTSGALVNQGNSPNPIPPGGSYTSPVITVNAGSCAFLMIDGFAGDACNYSVTLTNITGGCIILPLEFNGFNVYRNGETVKLNWEILSEIDNAYFTVEKSYDGMNFIRVSEVVSIGNHSSAYTYQTEDNFDRENGVYYRLSQTDLNGNSQILAIKYLSGTNVSDDNYFLMYPNPANDFVNVEFVNMMEATISTVEIFSMDGQHHSTQTIPVLHGMNNLQINTSDLPEGNYIIKIITPSKAYVEKFVKANK